MRVAVIDYGMGNLRSAAQAVRRVAPEATVEITADVAAIKAADRVIFPGQGAMPDCMGEMRRTGLEEAVRHAAACKPFLGICVGMQMLFDESEEGRVQGEATAGLGIFEGTVRRFPAVRMVSTSGERLKVPHMGWNNVIQSEPAHPLWQGVAPGARFYFVHSFYPDPANSAESTACADYPFRFTCAVARDNIFGVQFHPEKSHDAGLTLFANFVRWNP